MESASPVRGSFTLRCVEEWWETSGSGNNRSTRLVKKSVWSGTWQLESDRSIAGGQAPANFALSPARTPRPPTSSAAEKPIYWEFEVKLEMAGPGLCGNLSRAGVSMSCQATFRHAKGQVARRLIYSCGWT
jgi:hypothetical protein